MRGGGRPQKERYEMSVVIRTKAVCTKIGRVLFGDDQEISHSDPHGVCSMEEPAGAW